MFIVARGNGACNEKSKLALPPAPLPPVNLLKLAKTPILKKIEGFFFHTTPRVNIFGSLNENLQFPIKTGFRRKKSKF